MGAGCRGGAQWWEAPTATQTARAEGSFPRGARDTRLGDDARLGSGGIFIAQTAIRLQRQIKTSISDAVCGLWSGSIRKKIIGRGMRSVLARIAGGKSFRSARGTFALFEKPARQHGGGVLLHPLVNQRGNLFPEIGSVSQTRKFVGLQGVFGSRKKELPGGLRGAYGHRASVIEPL